MSIIETIGRFLRIEDARDSVRPKRVAKTKKGKKAVKKVVKKAAKKSPAKTSKKVGNKPKKFTPPPTVIEKPTKPDAKKGMSPPKLLVRSKKERMTVKFNDFRGTGYVGPDRRINKDGSTDKRTIPKLATDGTSRKVREISKGDGPRLMRAGDASKVGRKWEVTITGPYGTDTFDVVATNEKQAEKRGIKQIINACWNWPVKVAEVIRPAPEEKLFMWKYWISCFDGKHRIVGHGVTRKAAHDAAYEALEKFCDEYPYRVQSVKPKFGAHTWYDDHEIPEVSDSIVKDDANEPF